MDDWILPFKEVKLLLQSNPDKNGTDALMRIIQTCINKTLTYSGTTYYVICTLNAKWD